MFISLRVKNLICVFLVVLNALPSFGQGIFSKQKVKNQYAAFGIGGGTSHYFGDLSPYSSFYYGLYTNVRWNGTLNYTRYLTSNVGARVSFSYARIAGNDALYSVRNIDKFYQNYLRNLHFRNDIKEFAISGIYNLRDINGKNARSRADFMPYLTAGVGFIAHNPKARAPFQLIGGVPTLSNWTDLKPLNTSGQTLPGYSKQYSAVQVVFPVSAGFRLKLTERLDFAAEFGLRVTPFDYLDDVGDGLYVDPAILNSNFGATTADMAYRANENFSSYNLQDRVPTFIDIYFNRLPVAGTDPRPSPSKDAAIIYGYGVGSNRGTFRPDSYIMTQFTISYILSNSIKCPVIK